MWCLFHFGIYKHFILLPMMSHTHIIQTIYSWWPSDYSSPQLDPMDEWMWVFCMRECIYIYTMCLYCCILYRYICKLQDWQASWQTSQKIKNKNTTRTLSPGQTLAHHNCLVMLCVSGFQGSSFIWRCVWRSWSYTLERRPTDPLLKE